MPEAPAAPPPAAPPPAAPPPEIKASEMLSGATAPPRPGSAREALFKDLRKKAGMTEEPAQAPTPQQPTPASQPSDPPASPEPGEEPPTEQPSPGSTPETPPATTPEERKKVSPWKLVDQYKGRVSELEKEVADFKTKGIPQEKANEWQERMTKADARIKELEDEMRYVNYSKSQEFQEKYQQPYEKAWNAAMSELKEITIEDPQSGQRRSVQVDDLLQLVNLPLGQAREVADTLFGKFADDVMAHRKTIRQLFEQQSSALEDAKKNGAAREKDRMEKFQAFDGEMTKVVVDQWKRHNAALATDAKYGKYFQPVEGDEDGNQRLAKGFELADRAFGENPKDPRLTPEERASIIKRHAAVRNRAAAFGRLVNQNEKLATKIGELEKELAAFKASEPPTTGAPHAQPNGEAPRTGRAMDQVLAELRKRAK